MRLLQACLLLVILTVYVQSSIAAFTWPTSFDDTKTLLSGYTMKWKVTLAADSDQSASEIAIELSASTSICGSSSCWLTVGLGASSMSGGADAYGGFIDSSDTPQVWDMKISGQSTPSKDSAQNCLAGSTVVSSGGTLFVRI